jgi:type II secretory pathway pseudopilin PulG
MTRRAQEDGVVLVLVAVLMVAILITVGLVIDHGQLREDRQSNKRLADSAASAATLDLQVGPWAAVCTAYNYVLANADGFSSFTSETWTDAASPPTTLVSAPGSCPSGAPYSAPCVEADPTTWARFTGTAHDGDIEVDIQSGYSLPDPAFVEDGSIAGDDGSPCDQVSVIVREARTPMFGVVAGVNREHTTIRSVGRITPGESQVAALVVLERTACRAIDASTNGGKLVVHATTDTPGSISVDSDGSGCTGGQKVVEGSPLPSTQLPNVIAESTTTSPVKSGRISIFALGSNPGAANSTACASPTTSPCAISPVPRRLPVRITRDILDKRYLAAVHSAVAAADGALNAVPAGLTALTGVAGVDVTGGSTPTCRIDSDITVAAAGVYIDCDLIVESGGRLRLTGDGATVIAKGTITVNGTGSGSNPPGELVISRPSNFYVKGTNQGSALAIDIGGVLRVGDGGADGVSACPTPSPGNATSRMVVRLGTFRVGGGSSSLRLCQTAVVMGGGWQASGGAPPTAWPTTNGAAPYNNTFKSVVTVSGQGLVEWTAPNAVPNAPATATDWARLEDLTLWTEASTASSIGGQGGVELAGVFALPNADAFTIGGTGSQRIGADAQFWTRRLALSGAALLEMAPNPDDSVPTIDFALVR